METRSEAHLISRPRVFSALSEFPFIRCHVKVPMASNSPASHCIVKRYERTSYDETLFLLDDLLPINRRPRFFVIAPGGHGIIEVRFRALRYLSHIRVRNSLKASTKVCVQLRNSR